MRNPESSKARIPAPRFRGDKLTPAKAGAGMTNQRIGFVWLGLFAAPSRCYSHNLCWNKHLHSLWPAEIGFVLHNCALSSLLVSDFEFRASGFRPKAGVWVRFA